MRVAWAVALIVCAVVAVYGQVYAHGFIAFDDPAYVSDNPFVLRGLSLEGLRWAFTTGRLGNWNPLTWLSYMLELQVFGVNPGVQHVVNLAFHIANTLLLFGLLRRMTDVPWPSLTVAALFALHPLHVESVAWISERKDVLSTLWCFLALWAYARYAEQRSGRWYAALVGAFALGLMAKPMLVTLPFMLLLIDVWPLQRLAIPWGSRRAAPEPRLLGPQSDRRAATSPSDAAARRGAAQRRAPKVPPPAGRLSLPLGQLLWEKAPLFALAAIASLVAYVMQRESGAVIAAGTLPLGMRVANALVAYVRYLVMAAWPANLAVYYPYDVAMPLWQPLAAALCIAAVSVAMLRLAPRRPYALVGWLWYLGTLVPVIGLVQVGGQAVADRYTYIPLIGIFVILAWGGRDLAARWSVPAPVMAVAVSALLGAYAVVAWAQVRLWRDSETLLAHAARVTRGNCVAHNNLGVVLANQGDADAAIEHYQEALRIKPDYADAHTNLGAMLARQGRREAAAAHYRTALQYQPNTAETHSNLGSLLLELGQTDEALVHLADAVRIDPESADAHNSLGNGLRASGRLREAVAQYEQALHLRPDSAAAYTNLAAVLAEQGHPEQGAEQLRIALRHDPRSADAHYNLGLILIAQGRTDDAIEHLSEGVRLQPQGADLHAALGNALRAAGRRPEAIEHLQQAVRLDAGARGARKSLGAALVEADRLPEAIAQYEQAVALEPDDATARFNLGSTLARVGRFSEAIEQYRLLLARTPEDAEAWSNLAVAYAAAGQTPQAVDAAHTALDVARSHGDAAVVEAMQDWLRDVGAGGAASGRAADPAPAPPP